MALKRGGTSKAGPVLLEPVMEFEVTTPEEFLGEVMGDMTGRAAAWGTRTSGGPEDHAGRDPAGRAVRLHLTDLRSEAQGRRASGPMQLHAYNGVPRPTSRKRSLPRITGE